MEKLPVAFIERIQSEQAESAETFLAALEAEAPVSIRFNPNKNLSPDAPIHTLVASQVPWSSHGAYMHARMHFAYDPMWHAGAYYVQEASSMFLEQVFREVQRLSETPDVCVLDLCAAPGGKSTLISSLISENSLLVSNEIIRSRAHILSENLCKWGHPNTIVTQDSPAAWGRMSGMFDVIISDVPCSGEGMFRKDDVAIREWNPGLPQFCALRQEQIVRDAWAALKPGGFWIYSTCTFNRLENEDMLHWICTHLGARSLPIPFESAWGVEETDGPMYRFYPHKVRGEGFSIALLQKTHDRQDTWSYSKSKQSRVPLDFSQRFMEGIMHPDRYRVWQTGLTYSAIPSMHKELSQRIQSDMHVLKMGIPLGAIKGKDVLPDPAKALSTALEVSAVPSVDVPLDVARDYLRRNAIPLPEDTPKGWVLIKHGGLALGWMKNIGNRANNAWPAEWRLRT
ncbi:MAG TPA: hypothetical protein VJ871_06195 [Bacteroidales bacterium]|nr:hypothetical protein [Bacteroidales bacterium]